MNCSSFPDPKEAGGSFVLPWISCGQADKRLKAARSQFAKGVSGPVLSSLLDKLLDGEVINDEEREELDGNLNRTKKARDVVDTVRRKGSEASSFLIRALCETDQCLSKQLKFM